MAENENGLPCVELDMGGGIKRPAMTVHQTEVACDTARMAFELISRWGMVAATPAGEDSAGRQRLRLQTPSELVDRAFVVADLAFHEARRRGLMVRTPVAELMRAREQEAAELARIRAEIKERR
jgi:hypothetical protein